MFIVSQACSVFLASPNFTEHKYTTQEFPFAGWIERLIIVAVFRNCSREFNKLAGNRWEL